MASLAKYSKPAGTSNVGAQFGAEFSIAASMAPTSPSPTSPIVWTPRLPRVTSQMERRWSMTIATATVNAEIAQ